MPSQINLLQEYKKHPEYFAEDVFANVGMYKKQLEILDAVEKYPRVSVSSCHASGKTYCVAFLMLWQLFLYDKITIILLAPTLTQATSGVWNELVGLYNSKRCQLFPNEVLTKTKFEIDEKRFAQIRAVPAGSRAINTLRGVHNDRVLFVCEEATGITAEAYSAAEGSLLAGDARIVLISNPYNNAESNYFYDTFHKNKKSWHNIKISYKDVLKHGKSIKGLGTKIGYKEIENIYGKDSGEYKIKVLGEFANDNDTFAIINLDNITGAIKRDKPLKIPNDEHLKQLKEMVSNDDVCLGIDPAGEGADKSIIFYRKGLNGRVLKSYNKNDSLFLAGEVVGIMKELYQENGVYPSVGVDNIGLGTGVYDILKNNNDVNLSNAVVGINFGSKAHRNDLFYNKRAHGYYLTNQWLQFANIDASPNEEEQYREMSYINYKRDLQGRIQLEPKDKLKQRIGRSPDIPDAVVLSILAGLGSNISIFDEKEWGVV